MAASGWSTGFVLLVLIFSVVTSVCEARKGGGYRGGRYRYRASRYRASVGGGSYYGGSGGGGGGLSIGEIVGIIFGVLGGCIVLGVLYYLCTQGCEDDSSEEKKKPGPTGSNSSGSGPRTGEGRTTLPDPEPLNLEDVKARLQTSPVYQSMNKPSNDTTTTATAEQPHGAGTSAAGPSYAGDYDNASYDHNNGTAPVPKAPPPSYDLAVDQYGEAFLCPSLPPNGGLSPDEADPARSLPYPSNPPPGLPYSPNPIPPAYGFTVSADGDPSSAPARV